MILYDDAFANTPAPANAQGCLVYVGGDTPHPWTDEDIAKQGVRYLLPTWVRSNMGGTPQADGQKMIAWLRAHKAPVGISTVLDLETQVNPGYVLQYAAELHAAGYKVLPYGSKSTLFGNPKVDGFFVADYTGVAHLVAGTVITQFENNPGYDLDDVASGVVLWDTGIPDPAVPVPGPTPTSVTAEEDDIVSSILINNVLHVFYLDANGDLVHRFFDYTNRTWAVETNPGGPVPAPKA